MSNEPLAAGEIVHFVDSKDRRYMVTLKPGKEFHSHKGAVSHDSVIGQPEGRSAKTTARPAIW